MYKAWNFYLAWWSTSWVSCVSHLQSSCILILYNIYASSISFWLWSTSISGKHSLLGFNLSWPCSFTIWLQVNKLTRTLRWLPFPPIVAGVGPDSYGFASTWTKVSTSKDELCSLKIPNMFLRSSGCCNQCFNGDIIVSQLKLWRATAMNTSYCCPFMSPGL